MINRFHSAAPSAAMPNANSQTRKMGAAEDFGLFLDALVNPAQEAGAQTPQSLPQQQPVTIETPNADKAFDVLLQDDAAVGMTVADVIPPSMFPAPMRREAITPPSPTSHLVQISPVNMRPETVDPVRVDFPSALPGAENAVVDIAEPLRIANTQTDAESSIILPVQFEMARETVTALPPENAVPVARETIGNESMLASTKPAEIEVRVDRHSAAPGEVELVSMPWHLQANAALSYQSIAGVLKNSDMLRNETSPVLQHVADKANAGNRDAGIASVFSVAADAQIENAMMSFRLSEAVSTLANAFETARTFRAESRASLVMWPQRVLHWLSDGDGTTAWVRDYTLDANTTGTLVEALRCFSEQQGFTLRRIMLNGHEVWRAPSTF